eukprot:2725322-Pyramimonas_sp.AAC.1
MIAPADDSHDHRAGRVISAGLISACFCCRLGLNRHRRSSRQPLRRLGSCTRRLQPFVMTPIRLTSSRSTAFAPSKSPAASARSSSVFDLPF